LLHGDGAEEVLLALDWLLEHLWFDHGLLSSVRRGLGELELLLLLSTVRRGLGELDLLLLLSTVRRLLGELELLLFRTEGWGLDLFNILVLLLLLDWELDLGLRSVAGETVLLDGLLLGDD